MSWKDGLSSEQLEARRAAQRKYRQRVRCENTEVERVKAAKWRNENKDKIAVYNKAARVRIMSTPELAERGRARNRVANMPADQVEKKRASGRERSIRLTREALERGTTRYREEKTEETRKRDTLKMQKWREQNPDRNRATGCESSRGLRGRRGERANLDSKAARALRQTMFMGAVGRIVKSKYLPGYTSIALAKHLESLFADWMNWANYAERWEIDHIEPMSAFDYQSCEDEEYRRCWSLENLRPLCKIENREKGGIRGMF